MKTTNISFCVASDLFHAGRDLEEGTPIIGTVYYVVATFSDGSRYAHDATFVDTQLVKDDECELGAYYETICDAEEKAEKLCARIASASDINLIHWQEIDPVYGSNQYQTQDTERKYCLQERNA